MGRLVALETKRDIAHLQPPDKFQASVDGCDKAGGSGLPLVRKRVFRFVKHVPQPGQVRLQRLKRVREPHKAPEGAQKIAGDHVKAHQRAERHVAGCHPPPAETQHDCSAKQQEQVGERSGDVAEFGEFLPGSQLAGLIAAPAREEIILRGGCLQGFHAPHTSHSDAGQRALLADQLVAGIGGERDLPSASAKGTGRPTPRRRAPARNHTRTSAPERARSSPLRWRRLPGCPLPCGRPRRSTGSDIPDRRRNAGRRTESAIEAGG